MCCQGLGPRVKGQFRGLKKIVRNPQENAAWSEGCIDLTRIAKFVRLNTSALSDPDSLFVTLSLSPHSISTCTLIDSGSSHCFIDSSFVADHNISTTSIPPLGLRLFDGSCNSTITQAAELLVRFSCGESFNLTFYVTPLDSSCSSVLGRTLHSPTYSEQSPFGF